MACNYTQELNTMTTLKILPGLLLTLSAFTFAQEGAQSNLSRDPNVPPPEWNIQADPLKKGAPSVKDILGRAAKIYSKLDTYQDRSVMFQVRAGEGIDSRIETVTRFNKNLDRLWFGVWQLDQSGSRKLGTLLWKDKDQQRLWVESRNHVEAPTSIELFIAIDKPTQLAYGVESVRKAWADSAAKYRIDDISESGISYFRIQQMGASSYGDPKGTFTKTTYWIRKTDGLIVRIIRDTSDSDLQFKSYMRTDYEPIINQPIADSDFEFGH